MLKRKVIIGLIQMKMTSDPAVNLVHGVKKIREAAKKGAQIISLPELFKTRYFPQTKSRRYFSFAESVPGSTTEILGRLARQLKVVIIAPIFEKHSAKLYYNTAVVINAGGRIAGTYRKMHVPNDPRFYEKFYFTKGNLGIRSVQTKFGTIGVLICWDQWFPEPARLTALSGAQILFYPSAIAWHSSEPKKTRIEERNAWEVMHRAHAIANGIYVAVVNRVGREDKLNFWGHSFVSGPFGEKMIQAGEKQEEILIAECDLSKIKRVRQAWPFLKERRIDLYRNLK